MKKRILSAIIIATVVLGATYTPECYAIEEITPPLTKKELREQFNTINSSNAFLVFKL